MAGVMRVVLPVAAIALAAYTGGTSLGLIGGGEAAGAAGAAAADAASFAPLDIGAAAAESALPEGATAAAGGSTILGSAFQSVSPYLKTAGAVGQIAGIVTNANGIQQQSANDTALANYQATQLQNNANNAMGAAEIKSEQQDRETAYVISNAQAAAAAGGGSATDPTVTNNLKTIAGEGRFRALTDMYAGQATAQADQNQAAATQYGASLAVQANNTKFDSTILGGASSLFDKYANVGTSLPPWAQTN